jgi:hypothetical protein
MGPVVFLHGFEDEVLFEVVRAVKKAILDAGLAPETVAFASSTENNKEWTVRELIEEVRKEHEIVTGQHAPGGTA